MKRIYASLCVTEESVPRVSSLKRRKFVLAVDVLSPCLEFRLNRRLEDILSSRVFLQRCHGFVFFLPLFTPFLISFSLSFLLNLLTGWNWREDERMRCFLE